MDTFSLGLDLQLALRIVIALILGALIGYDRERTGKSAGVRTYALVSIGSALFTIVSAYGFHNTGDPGRIAAQIVTGIGFLGAGLIYYRTSSKRGIYGLTSAAGLWLTAAIGMAVGAGLIVVATFTALLSFMLLGLPIHIPTAGKNTKSEAGKRDTAILSRRDEEALRSGRAED